MFFVLKCEFKAKGAQPITRRSIPSTAENLFVRVVNYESSKPAVTANLLLNITSEMGRNGELKSWLNAWLDHFYTSSLLLLTVTTSQSVVNEVTAHTVYWQTLYSYLLTWKKYRYYICVVMLCLWTAWHTIVSERFNHLNHHFIDIFILFKEFQRKTTISIMKSND